MFDFDTSRWATALNLSIKRYANFVIVQNKCELTKSAVAYHCNLHANWASHGGCIMCRRQTGAASCCMKIKTLPTLIVRSRDAEYSNPCPPQMIFSTESACPESVTSQRPVRVFQISQRRRQRRSSRVEARREREKSCSELSAALLTTTRACQTLAYCGCT